MIIQVNNSNKKTHTNITTVSANGVNSDWTKYAWWSAAFILITGIVIFIRSLFKRSALLKAEKAKQDAALEKAKMAPEVIDPLKVSRDLMASGDFTNFYK